MANEEIRAGLAEILEEVAGVLPADVSEEKSFTDDLDVDSLSMVEIALAAEERFGVKIPDDELANLKTVGDAVCYIEKAKAALTPASTGGCAGATARPDRRRHRARRHHAARRRRRLDLGGPARRPVRGHARSTDEWARDFPARIVARMAVEPTDTLERVEARRLDRCQQAALVAGRRGLGGRRLRPGQSKAGADETSVDPERLAVVIGSGIGGALTMLGQDDVLEERGVRRVSPLTVPMLMPNGPAAALGLEFGARAGVHTTVSACASGAEAIALGLGPDPARPRRRGRRRRHRGGRAPAADGRLRADAGDVHPQRRAGAGLPPVRQGPGRVRARRGRRRAGAGERRARRGPRGAGRTRRSPAPASPPTATTSPRRTRAAAARPGR